MHPQLRVLAFPHACESGVGKWGGDTGRSPTGRPERQLVQHEGGAGWGGGAPRGPSGLTRISPALGTPW